MDNEMKKKGASPHPIWRRRGRSIGWFWTDWMIWEVVVAWGWLGAVFAWLSRIQKMLESEEHLLANGRFEG